MSLVSGNTWTPPVNRNGGIVAISFDYSVLTRVGVFLGTADVKVKQAVSNAVNRALEHFKTIEVKETARKYYVKQKDIRSSIMLKKSHGGSMHGTLISRGHRKSLTKYATKPGLPPVKKGTFMGAVKKEGGLKKIPKGFLIPHSSGIRAVIRERAGKDGLAFLTSPSVPQLMKNQSTVFAAEREAREVFKKRFDHELKRLLEELP